jgi:hypothetical protein
MNKIASFMKQRRPLMVFETEDFDEFIKEIDKPIDYKNALTILHHQPLGTKCLYDSEKFDSIFEAIVWAYYKKLKGIPIERNHIEWLSYTDETGKKRKWFYDFKIAGKMVEVKGRFFAKDEAKQSQHPEVEFLTSVEILPMKKQVLKEIPNFMDEVIKL